MNEERCATFHQLSVSLSAVKKGKEWAKRKRRGKNVEVIEEKEF
jgi:hypothetical protein